MSTVLSPELTERTRQLSDANLVLVIDAYREGRYLGGVTARREVEAFVRACLEELERQYTSLTPEAAALFEEELHRAGAPTPLTAAHFGGAADALQQVKSELERLAKLHWSTRADRGHPGVQRA